MESQPSSSSTDPKMNWMYEGTKSLVNREDYLLGKKIDKNFELYSDVVNKDNEEERRDEFFRRSVLQSTGGDNHKISALDTRVVRNEDPLVALKFQEEQRKRQMLDNPLLKLRAQRVLRKALEKELKKETKKKSHRRRKSSTSSSSDSEKNVREEKRHRHEDERKRRSGSRDYSMRKAKKRRSRSATSGDRDESKRNGRSRHRHNPSRSPNGDGRHEHRRSNASESDRPIERKEQRHRDHEEKDATRVGKDAGKSRSKMGREEMEERRKAMMANASWRDEQREHNFKRAEQILQKEEAQASSAPNFIKPMLSTATTNSSLEKRLQSNRMNIQRTHDHMDKSFIKK